MLIKNIVQLRSICHVYIIAAIAGKPIRYGVYIDEMENVLRASGTKDNYRNGDLNYLNVTGGNAVCHALGSTRPFSIA